MNSAHTGWRSALWFITAISRSFHVRKNRSRYSGSLSLSLSLSLCLSLSLSRSSGWVHVDSSRTNRLSTKGGYYFRQSAKGAFFPLPPPKRSLLPHRTPTPLEGGVCVCVGGGRGFFILFSFFLSFFLLNYFILFYFIWALHIEIRNPCVCPMARSYFGHPEPNMVDFSHYGLCISVLGVDLVKRTQLPQCRLVKSKEGTWYAMKDSAFIDTVKSISAL